ncbi:hypothetical protein [Leifsonia sp. Leaf264]|uniref:hypothetical protein n=1 Tax=Leifsonia sp. Leaf264 TaxID=1736314 RepID=UPI0006F750AD|nr:hypothetical protein [Leifsonia sp. Leaf264]KQO98313.1 hypothetical protein ASF30_09645 [Leifsonia sp. Leaf264]
MEISALLIFVAIGMTVYHWNREKIDGWRERRAATAAAEVEAAIAEAAANSVQAPASTDVAVTSEDTARALVALLDADVFDAADVADDPSGAWHLSWPDTTPPMHVTVIGTSWSLVLGPKRHTGTIDDIQVLAGRIETVHSLS